MIESTIITQLIDIESRRAFPNQFEVTILGDKDISSIPDFSFYAKKVALGSHSITVDRLGSIQRTYIKKATIPDTITLTVKELNDWTILKFFYDWYTTSYYDPEKNLFISGRDGKKKSVLIYAFCDEYRPSGELVDALHKTHGDGKQAYGLKIAVADALLVGSVSLPTFTYDDYQPVEHNFTIQSDNIKIEWITKSGAL